MTARVLFVGLGNMGRGMCKNIVEKGNLDHPLMIHNRSKQRAVDLSRTLPAEKTEVVESLEDGVAAADVIFTCLANDAAVNDTLTAMLKGDVKGKLFVDCSTIHPESTEAAAKAVFAEKSGLGTEHLHQLMEMLFPAPYAAYSKRMLSGDYYKREEPLFAVDLARKDMGHAMNLAKAAGTRLLNIETADAHLVKVKEHAGAKGDLPGIYGAVRQEAGLKYENDA